MSDREQGIFYDEKTAKQWGECCEKCGDVTFDKTYPAHTPYYACTNLKCICHLAAPTEEEWAIKFEKQFYLVGTDERDSGQGTRDEIKEFIRRLLASKEKEGYQKGLVENAIALDKELLDAFKDAKIGEPLQEIMQERFDAGYAKAQTLYEAEMQIIAETADEIGMPLFSENIVKRLAQLRNTKK